MTKLILIINDPNDN